MKTKNRIIIKLLIGFIVILNFAIAFHLNPSNEETQLASLFRKALADDEGDPNVCLQTYTYEPNTYFVRDQECWRDQPGPDKLEGYVGHCNANGFGCNPMDCKSITGCYVVNL